MDVNNTIYIFSMNLSFYQFINHYQIHDLSPPLCFKECYFNKIEIILAGHTNVQIKNQKAKTLQITQKIIFKL